MKKRAPVHRRAKFWRFSFVCFTFPFQPRFLLRQFSSYWHTASRHTLVIPIQRPTAFPFWIEFSTPAQAQSCTQNTSRRKSFSSGCNPIQSASVGMRPKMTATLILLTRSHTLFPAERPLQLLLLIPSTSTTAAGSF